MSGTYDPEIRRDPDATNQAKASGSGTPGGVAAHETDESSIPDLLRKLTDQGSHLASQQVALVKAEIGESIDDLKVGLSAMVGAAVVGIAALGVFLMALGHLLGMAIGEEDTVGWGLLIVAVVTLIIAYVMYQSATKKLNATNLTPERTQHTLERTPDAAAGNL